MSKKLGFLTAAALAVLSTAAFAGQSVNSAPPGEVTWQSQSTVAQPAAPAQTGHAMTYMAGPYDVFSPSVGG